MMLGYRSPIEIRRKMRDAKRRSGLPKKWANWNSVEFCDNCGRNRIEARIYPDYKVPYYIWEHTPWEITKQEFIRADLCEVCIAFLNERGILP